MFEDRYGVNSYARLITMLGQPCVTFTEIAERFGVSRERARQWQLKYLPDSPRGHQRQRLCLLQHEKRKLLTDPLFRAFYRDARGHFRSGQFVLIRARDGYRKRSVRLGPHLVAIKNARAIPSSKRSAATSYVLTSSVAPADFIYYRLDDGEYLVVPHNLVPRAGTTFIDTTASRFRPYRNTFAVVPGTSPAPQLDDVRDHLREGESDGAAIGR
ncbi:MAG: hypothetical protein GEU82_00840 [Luteitalea sp.]|nr:hypothetical protein [Luteitalea sp.]